MRRLFATTLLILVLTRDNEWRAFEGYEDVTAEYFGTEPDPPMAPPIELPGEDYGSSSADSDTDPTY